MVKTILFDFDGTLVNTNDVIIVSFQHTFRHYLKKEVAAEKIAGFFGEPLRVTMEREIPEVSPEEAMETYRKYQKLHPELVKVFDGVPEMLEELKEKGFRLAIVTARTGASTFAYLDQFGLRGYFETIVSCDDTDAHKPEPEPIYCALRKLGAEKDEVVMIGDGPFDIACARNAGVTSVLVGWRITPDKEKPDYFIEKPEDLICLIDDINSMAEN